MGKSKVIGFVRAARVATVGLLAGALIFSGASLAIAEDATSPDATAAATEGEASSSTSSSGTGEQTASEAPPVNDPPSSPPAPALPSASEQVSPPSQPEQAVPPAEPAPTESAPDEQPVQDAAPQPEDTAPVGTEADAPAAEIPALRWQTVDSTGTLVSATTVTLEGPRNAEVEDLGGDEQWTDAPTTAVADNTGAADYTGLDLDPAPGVFRIEQFADEELLKADATTAPTPVTAGSDYRVRPAEADGYLTGDDAEWTTLAVLTDAAAEAQDVTLASVEPADPQARELAPQAEITPLADNSHADIVVRKRVFAEPGTVTAQPSVNIGTNYDSTVGTVFRLYTYTNNSNTPGTATNYTCTITAGGQCTITVDQVNSNGTNNGRRFWVVETTPVSGSPAADTTYINDELFVGDYTGPTSSRRLVGVTKALAANQTTYMPMTSGVNSGTQYTNIASAELPGSNSPSTAEAGSFGAVVGSYNNPAIAARCEATPLRIGIILDQSASITSNQWTTFRNALVASDGVLRQLRSANAAVSILGFGTGVTGANGWHYGQNGPEALPANNNTLNGLIPTSRPGGDSNATNWDAALSTMQAANATHDYDMVLFVTDGAPNYILASSQVSGYDVTLRSLEAPMYAANAMKAAGTRVVSVGVGPGATSSNVAKNLRAVSGPTNGADYLQGDWDRLQQILTDIVSAATCQIPVDVSKTQLNANGTTTTTAANWQFTAALENGTTNGVTLTGNASQTTTAGDQGKARWTIKFTQPGGQTAVLKLSETQKPGWILQSVSCTLNGQPISTTIGGDGVSIVVSDLFPNSGALSCVYTNKESTPASLVVNKNWVVDGETFADGDQPDGMDAVLGLNPAGQTGTPEWGQTRTGFLVGESVTISETTTIDAQLFPGCVLTGSTIAGPGIPGTPALPAEGRAVTLATASSTYTVTNTVECQRLTIIKEVENRFGGNASATDWNDGLFAKRSSDPQMVFDSGQTQYVQTGAYVLSEADIAGYQQRELTCTGGALTGDSIQIDAGANVVCTFVNEDIAGQVTWTKTDGTDELAGSEWTLTGPGGSSVQITDCVGADVAACAGMPDQDPDAGAFLLEDLDWGDYTLVESAAPLGYVLDTTPRPFTVDATTVGSVIALGAIVNTLGVAPALPMTGGLGADFYTFFGFGVLLLALLLLAIRRLWARRQVAVAGNHDL